MANRDVEPAPDVERRIPLLEAVRNYARERFSPKEFVPGETFIPASGKCFGEDEVVSLVDAALDFWLTAGRYADAFETGLARRLGHRFSLMVNSGSSANLLAVSALLSPLLGKRSLNPGDEVITAAAGFPTTVNPILQNGLTPVFIDSHVPTYNPTIAMIEEAISPRTRAVFLAHTLGNPYEANHLQELCERKSIWLLEDCCDAFGSRVAGKPVSRFGAIGTLSFYPAHHITTGEGGAVVTSDPRLKKALESLRDWGRDCWCAPGKDNTCGKRFNWTLGDLPSGYDHKYTYSHAGYNLKATDLQAAVGLVQLGRLDTFVANRNRNFIALRSGLSRWEEHLILPESLRGAEPSWFGLPITIREKAPFRREDLTQQLEQMRIGTRLLFGGNLTRQPYLRGRTFRRVGGLTGADEIMRNTFWIGVHPTIDPQRTEYMLSAFEKFFSRL